MSDSLDVSSQGGSPEAEARFNPNYIMGMNIRAHVQFALGLDGFFDGILVPRSICGASLLSIRLV
ncbi:unnamed protein product [Fusarium venenatum]|uniref:Uncharacterized protein n=1 Tax=Fusarium venenatum TaxID=56646 RepID=A0A2L2T3Q3_9HYPO|nr:uncharacterized protein FVRRES_06699 [Fusarium venenatum]CEI62263.1 unnamed protein product [Fusarium venenatum]